MLNLTRPRTRDSSPRRSESLLRVVPVTRHEPESRRVTNYTLPASFQAGTLGHVT